MNKEKIKEIRLNAGKTQKEFAAALFVSERSVRNWESGINKPNARSIMDMEKIEAVSEEIKTTFFDALKIGIETAQKMAIAAQSVYIGKGGIVSGEILTGDLVVPNGIHIIEIDGIPKDQVIVFNKDFENVPDLLHPSLTKQQIDNLLNGSWKVEVENE